MAKFFLDIEIQGAKKVQRQLFRGAERAGNMRPSLFLVREDMFRVIKQTFLSQGRRGGGSWQFLDPETVRRKLDAGRDPRILISRHRLMNSFTQRSSRYMRSKITKDQILLDSTLPYADTHQYGDESRGIPARPFIHFLPADKKRWVKQIEQDLIRAMHG